MDEHRLMERITGATNEEEMREVAKDAIRIPFEDENMEEHYRKTPTTLDAHEGYFVLDNVMVDAVQVRPLGMGAGYQIQVNGSHYTRCKKMDGEIHASAHKAGGAGRVPVTAIAKVDLHLTPNAMDGEAVVIFKEGHE